MVMTHSRRTLDYWTLQPNWSWRIRRNLARLGIVLLLAQAMIFLIIIAILVSSVMHVPNPLVGLWQWISVINLVLVLVGTILRGFGRMIFGAFMVLLGAIGLVLAWLMPIVHWN